jgi:hypothetical protein
MPDGMPPGGRWRSVRAWHVGNTASTITRLAISRGDHLAQGRDAAEAASRLARNHRLPWCDPGAVQAHALLLDRAEGMKRGWAARSGALSARLGPADLDPGPWARLSGRPRISTRKEHRRRRSH